MYYIAIRFKIEVDSKLVCPGAIVYDTSLKSAKEKAIDYALKWCSDIPGDLKIYDLERNTLIEWR